MEKELELYIKANYAKLEGDTLVAVKDAFEAAWQARVPEGYKVVKKSQLIGNQNVDWSQAPEWANYWLKDGHSDKFWWSKSRPVKDNDLGCFVWGSGYMAEEAPSFGFTGAWDKSMTSKKAMIEAVEK